MLEERADLRRRVIRRDRPGPVATEDFGAPAVFLASSDSAWLTGEIMVAGGGLR